MQGPAKEQYATGFALVSDALKCDELNDAEGAYNNYKEGIGYLLAGTNVDTIDSQRTRVRKAIKGFIDRAEILNQVMKEKKEDVAREEVASPSTQETATTARPTRKAGPIAPPSKNGHLSQPRKVPARSLAPPLRKTPSGKDVRGDGGNGALSMKDAVLKKLPDDIDKKMVESILGELVDTGRDNLTWNDIAGLQSAKEALNEAVLLPALRPDLYTGLRAPPKGLLLFGPPGTGKTMLAKVLAKEAGCTFFSISASTLVSKWVGDSEKMIRVLFAVARAMSPSIIFIDEIDSILTARSSEEHEASRRLKTEFLVQTDGIKGDGTERVIVIGATNRPQELDEAAKRRLGRQIYIPLPDSEARLALIQNLLDKSSIKLPKKTMDQIVSMTNGTHSDMISVIQGYSGSDLTLLCREAAIAPLRELGARIADAAADDLRPLKYEDFLEASKKIRPTVSKESLQMYDLYNKQFGIV